MSASRSATTVISAADCTTCLAYSAVSTQCTDSRSASGRGRCGAGFTPSRLHTSPPPRPRHDPLAASTAIPRLRRGMHRMHQYAVRVVLLDWTEAAATLHRGRELHLAPVFNQQDVPPGAGRASQRAPSFDIF